MFLERAACHVQGLVQEVRHDLCVLVTSMGAPQMHICTCVFPKAYSARVKCCLGLGDTSFCA